jgi:phage shock protein E
MKQLLFILLFILLVGCSKVDDDVLKAAHVAVNNGAIIIDVRTPSEFKTKHIKGALNFPLQGLNKSYVNLPQNKEIIVYCRSGNRSATARKFLMRQGYTVFDVATQNEWERGFSL